MTEPVELLRAALRRGRPRARLVLVGVAAVVALVAVVAVRSSGDGHDPGVRTAAGAEGPSASASSTTSTVATTTSTTTTDPGPSASVPPAVAATPTTTVPGDGTGPLTADELAGRPTSYVRAVAGEQGIGLLDLGPLPLRRVTDQPARIAYVTYLAVVAQLGSVADGEYGPIVVFDEHGSHELVAASAPQDDGLVELHDVGWLDGRSVALVSRTTGSGPGSWSVRLLVVDVLTGAERDLGRVGGWESGVQDARLAADGVIVMMAYVAGNALELRRYDGTTAWWVDSLGGDAVRSMTGAGWPAGEVWVLEPDLDDPAAPKLVVRRFEVVEGTELGPIEVTLAVDPAVHLEPHGLCDYAELGKFLLCDQRDGAPVQIRIGRTPGTAHVGTEPSHDAPGWGAVTFYRYG